MPNTLASPNRIVSKTSLLALVGTGIVLQAARLWLLWKLEEGEHFASVMRGLDMGLGATGAERVAAGCLITYVLVFYGLLRDRSSTLEPALWLIGLTDVLFLFLDKSEILSWHVTSFIFCGLGVIILVKLLAAKLHEISLSKFAGDGP